MATRGLDWRALLSQPPAKVVNRSPFSATQQDSEKQTKHPKAAAAPGATQPTKTVEQQPEYVVPILVTKHSVRQIPASAKVDQAVEPEQQLRKLQELQQQTSSLLAAAAELAKQGERKQDQQPDQQQQHDADDPYLRRPVPPPQHAQQDDPYFWSGSTTSAYYGPETAGGAAAAAGGLGKHQSGSQHLPGNSSSDVGPSSAGGGIGGTASMDTSATTRMLPSQGHSEMVTTAGSGSACWGSALSRLKQLQLQTSEALGVQ